MENEKIKNSIAIKWAIGMIGLGGLIVIFLIVWLWYSDYGLAIVNNESLDNIYKIGGVVGGVIGPLWALAGVFIYYYALKLQAKSIDLNTEELDKQQFESIFFNLLQTQHQIRISINGKFQDVIYDINIKSLDIIDIYKSGYDFFQFSSIELRSVYDCLKNKFEYVQYDKSLFNTELLKIITDKHRGIYSSGAKYDIDIKLGKIKKYYKLYSYGIIEQKIYDKIKDTSNERARCEYLYLMLFFKTHSAIGHYCRHLYNIVKFIHKERMRCFDKYSQSDKKHKKEIENRFMNYIAFVQAQMSTEELFILFYNSLIYEKAANLYKEYNIFENMPIEMLLDRSHEEFIDGISFKSSIDMLDRIMKKM